MKRDKGHYTADCGLNFGLQQAGSGTQHRPNRYGLADGAQTGNGQQVTEINKPVYLDFMTTHPAVRCCSAPGSFRRLQQLRG
jgi:hypothetical protein